MSEEPEAVVPIVVQEVPDNCDTCDAGLGMLNPIRQRRRTSFGTDWMVVGYRCDACNNDHLYR